MESVRCSLRGGTPRSVGEIRRHLRAKRYDDEAIDGAIDKLRAQRYVDDLDFAKYWVEQRSRFRPKGDRALVSELTSKGVARETIDAALGDLPAESEGDRARRAIARQLRRWESLEPRERKRERQVDLGADGHYYVFVNQRGKAWMFGGHLVGADGEDQKEEAAVAIGNCAIDRRSVNISSRHIHAGNHRVGGISYKTFDGTFVAGLRQRGQDEEECQQAQARWG